jgi:hypothetical protein
LREGENEKKVLWRGKTKKTCGGENKKDLRKEKKEREKGKGKRWRDKI